MGTASSRRPPYPYSALISGIGVRTRGDIVGRKVQSLAAGVPNNPEFGHEDLYRERSFSFGRAILGMGERVQSGPYARRYRYAINAWHVGRVRGKGPKRNTITPASTGSIADFVEALHGGVATQFILAGRYCLRRDGDANGDQAVSKDFGAARTATSGVRYKPAGGTDSLYVTLDNGDLWQYDGTNWIGPAAAAGTWNGDALLCFVVAEEFWIKDSSNTLRKATADPMTGGNYSGQFTCGDGSLAINALAALNDRIVALMDNGKLFSVLGDGTTADVEPGLATSRSSTNGINGVWLDSLFFRNGESLLRAEGLDGLTIRPAGMERLLDNDSEVTGPVVAFAGYGTWCAFFGIYNSGNSASYLMQYGAWLPPSEGGDPNYQFGELINGALVKFTGKRMTVARVSTLVAGNPRLYLGFADGTFEWIKLPKNGPNPFAADSGCEFSEDSDTYTRWPIHTMLAPNDNKAYLNLAASGPVLDSTKYLTIQFRTDLNAALRSFAASLTDNGVEVAFSESVAGRQIEIEEHYVSPSSASTPVVESLVLEEQLRPSTRLEYTLPIIARHRVGLRNGATCRLSPEQIRDAVKGAADAPGLVTLVLPDETSQGFSAVNYQETIHPDAQRYGMEWDLDASFIQYRTNSIYGTVDRLGPYTVDDLGGATVNDLGVL